MRPFVLAALLGVLCAPSLARAYEGAVTREEQPPPPKTPTLTRAPELVTFVQAEYPKEAEAQGLAGEVGLVVDIAADGKVSAVEVVRPAGHGFDEAALAAVKGFVFSPAELDGVPAAVRIEYTYRFVLREPPPPAPTPDLTAPPAPESLKGRAIERASRKPLVGANVHCDETGEDVLTDEEGRFALHLLPGAFHVRVAAAGYHSFVREEVIEEGKLLEVTYHLMPVSYGLFQTVVRAERDKREATQRTLAREELQRIPGTMGDPIRVVQNLPGVARAPYLSGALIVRGAAPEETGTYLDSVEIPLLYHFMGGPSVVNPEFLDRLDFLPGGFGSRYGRAIGGIIDAYTRKPTLERAHGSLKTDLLDTAAFLEVPLTERISVAAAARRSYVDLILPAFMPDDPETGSVSILPVYWDYQVRADYGKASDAHQLTLMAFGSDDTMTVAAKGGQAERDLSMNMHINFHRLRLGYLFREGKFANLLVPYFGRDASGGGMENAGEEVFGGGGTSWDGGLRDEAAYEFAPWLKARLGADLKFASSTMDMTIPGVLPDYRRFPGSSPVTETQTLHRSLRESVWGLYHEWELTLFERLTLIPGVRFDVFHFAGKNELGFDPRLVARFKLFAPTTLKGSIGHFTMSPGSFVGDPEYGNPDIGLPKAFQSSLGVEHKLTEVIDVDVTGFYNRRYDLVVPTGDVAVGDDGSVRPKFFANEGLGRAYGVEILLRHNLTRHFFGWLAYTFSRTEERRHGDAAYKPGSYDEPHILTAVAQYNFGSGWSIGGRFRLVSGRPYTPFATSTYDGDTNQYEPISAEDRSGRNPLFHQLDLRVDKEFLFDLWKFGVYLDIQNAYNAKNVEAWQWDYRYRERTGIPGMPILPTLGFKGAF